MLKTKVTLDDIENGDVSEVGSYSYMSDAELFGMTNSCGPMYIETDLGNGLSLKKTDVDASGVLYKQPSAEGMPSIELFISY